MTLNVKKIKTFLLVYKFEVGYSRRTLHHRTAVTTTKHLTFVTTKHLPKAVTTTEQLLFIKAKVKFC